MLENSLALAAQYLLARRLPEAEALYSQILSENPDQPDALHLLGVVRLQSGQPDDAKQLIERAIAANPNVAEYHNNLGNIFIRKGRFEDAIAAFQRAVSLRPNYAKALSNLGGALKSSGQFESAHQAYLQAIAASPNSVEAHWNFGLLLLTQGDFRRGWPEYEYRLELPELWGVRRCAAPKWDGGNLDGKSILLHPEGGFGDAIQFARYVPMVAQKGGRIVLEVRNELYRLFESIEGVDTLIRHGQPLPAYDVHCPLMSLPLALAATLDTIPSNVPYLSVPEALTRQWSDRLPHRKRLRVGLVWAGDPKHRRDRNRSIALSELAELGRVPDADFFSLQKGPSATQATPDGMNLIDWTNDFQDFANTAALILNLDLVITVDTAVAHVAGALAKPVWVLLPVAPDWRWMINRTDSPWYPTMRLFRQQKPGQWDTVIQSAAQELTGLKTP